MSFKAWRSRVFTLSISCSLFGNSIESNISNAVWTTTKVANNESRKTSEQNSDHHSHHSASPFPSHTHPSWVESWRVWIKNLPTHWSRRARFCDRTASLSCLWFLRSATPNSNSRILVPNSCWKSQHRVSHWRMVKHIASNKKSNTNGLTCKATESTSCHTRVSYVFFPPSYGTSKFWKQIYMGNNLGWIEMFQLNSADQAFRDWVLQEIFLRLFKRHHKLSPKQNSDPFSQLPSSIRTATYSILRSEKPRAGFLSTIPWFQNDLQFPLWGVHKLQGWLVLPQPLQALLLQL